MVQPGLEKIFYPTNNTIASPADIVSSLVPFIQNCSTVEFPETLLNHIGKIANKRPKDIETICKALSMLLNNPEIRDKQLKGPDYLTTFGQAHEVALSEEISDGLGDVYSADDNGNLSIDSTNIRLTAALLSASAIKHNLQDDAQHIPLSIVLMGLQNPHVHLESKKKEVYGVVAIIHLAIVGDKMHESLESNFSGEEEITRALKSLMHKRVFKSPSSVKLLERATANAESGYEKNMSENEVWDLLFRSPNRSLATAPSYLHLSFILAFHLSLGWLLSYLWNLA